MARRFGRDELKARLRESSPAVLPSLLACDFANLRQEIERVEEAGVAALHLDVMDGHFVPNLSIGVPIVEAVRRVTDLPLDVHLMIEQPQHYVKPFREAGADSMTIHIEALPDPRPVLDQIRSLGAMAGLALNPPTPLTAIERSLSHCDMLLVMSVMPGFGGQEFDERAYEKLRVLRDRRDVDALLEVDGGVNTTTIDACAEAGADLLVAGVAIFHTPDYPATIRQLHALARQGLAATHGSQE
jgi:ribulose-phosphate 3-epimerase